MDIYACKTKSCLCVDNFGVKCQNHEHVQHLINTLKEAYDLKADFSGKNYCRITLYWNYTQGYVDLSMPTYADKMLENYKIHLP